MINTPLIKGHYDWNGQTNSLEFISDRETGGDERKRKSRSGFNLPAFSFPQFAKDRNTPIKSVRGVTSAGNPGYKPTVFGAGQRVSPRLGFFRNENSTVTIEDVKSVALAEIKREKEDARLKLSAPFLQLYQSEQFNKFLVTMLRYFECFLEGIDQQKRPHKTNYLQPSKAEIQAMENTKRKMNVTKKHLGQSYCVLLLGIGLEKQHHMGCGKQRVSASHRDQRMYEDLYLFCTNFVYITFRRREYTKVLAEVGDMLRSPTFNPSQRKSRPLSDDDGARPSKPYFKDVTKPIGERIEELLAVKLPSTEKITPAAYRRQYGKRPAIMKAIRQRSTALVSLLPLPEESSEYLFKTAGLGLSENRSTDLEGSDGFIPFDFYSLQKIGIIGEPLELFDPESLTPKSVDTDEDTESRDTESPASQTNELLHGKISQPDQRSISRATTEASMPV